MNNVYRVTISREVTYTVDIKAKSQEMAHEYVRENIDDLLDDEYIVDENIKILE